MKEKRVPARFVFDSVQKPAFMDYKAVEKAYNDAYLKGWGWDKYPEPIVEEDENGHHLDAAADANVSVIREEMILYVLGVKFGTLLTRFWQLLRPTKEAVQAKIWVNEVPNVYASKT